MRSRQAAKRSRFSSARSWPSLGLPDLAPDLGLDHALDLQRVGQRGQPGLVDEEVLLLLLEGRQDVAHGLGGALDHLLEDRDALEQVLVEREVLLGSLLLELDLVGARPRQHQQLLVAAVAVLGLVVLQRAADLTEHFLAGGRSGEWLRHPSAVSEGRVR